MWDPKGGDSRQKAIRSNRARGHYKYTTNADESKREGVADALQGRGRLRKQGPHRGRDTVIIEKKRIGTLGTRHSGREWGERAAGRADGLAADCEPLPNSNWC